MHASIDGRHVGNPSLAGRSPQLIHQGIYVRDVPGSLVFYLPLPVPGIAHLPVGHQLMISDRRHPPTCSACCDVKPSP
jgi:hypothetical protein